MSRDIVSCWVGLWAGFDAAGLVVAGGVEFELAEECAVLGDDADVEVGGEDEHVGAVVRVADADVVQAAVVAQGHAAAVDDVAADAAVRLGQPAGGGGAGPGVPCLGRRAATERAVGPLGVVDLGERVELGLQVRDGRAGIMRGEPAFERLVEALDLAAGLGMVGTRVRQSDVQRGEVTFERDLAAAAGGGGEDRGVVGEHAGGQPVAAEGIVEGVDDAGGVEGGAGVAGDREARCGRR